MTPYFSRMSSRALAEHFLATMDHHSIVPVLISLFGLTDTTCFDNDPELLDVLIQQFEASDCTDADILTEIIDQRRRRMHRSEAQEQILLKQIKDNIHLHLLDDITMKQLAASLHIDYYYFCKLFKHQTGLSPNQYRIRKRVEKSIPLLLDTEKHIAEIASLCGFSNASYFSKQFQDLTGMQPKTFRKQYASAVLPDFLNLESTMLALNLEHLSLLANQVTPLTSLPTEVVPLLPFSHLLHNSSVPAVIEYRGILYAAWYNYSVRGTAGYTSILSKRSVDSGKSWSQTEVIEEDLSGESYYFSPAFLVSDDMLYLILSVSNTSTKKEHIQFYRLDPDTERFRRTGSLPILFNASTNPVTLPDGRLLIPGRTRVLYPYDNIPSVLISDTPHAEGSWHLIPVLDSPILADGSQLIYSQLSCILCNKTLYLFCRNDQRNVPLVFLSHDFGESWSTAYRHDIPSVRSKFYSGTLSDGQHYMIANTNPYSGVYDHSKLSIYFSGKDSVLFDRELVLFNRAAEPPLHADICYEPCAVEYDGKLHVVACAADHETGTRGIFDFILPLNQI